VSRIVIAGWRKYRDVAVVSLQTALAYPVDVLARAGFMAIVIFVFSQLWTVTFSLADRPTVGGFDLSGMLWYLVLTETIVMSCPRTFNKIDREVKSGDLAYMLNRPYNYAIFQYATYLGSALLALPINFTVGAGLALALAGPPHVPGAAWPAIALAVLLAISLNFVVELAIGLLAFWFEDTYAFFWIYQKTVFTLGGLFLPIEVFPSTLRALAAHLPFTSIAYAPARLASSFSVGAFLETIGTQVVWICALAALAALIYRGGVRRLSLNGG
jgi:ABC-2 type transport system permease protein